MARELIQDSFIYGEVSQAAQAMPTKEQYFSSLARCRNAMPIPGGGVTNRRGTTLIGNVSAYVSDTTRMLSMVSSLGTNIILLFPQDGTKDVHAVIGSTIYTYNFDAILTAMSYDDTQAITEAFNDVRGIQIGTKFCFSITSNVCFTIEPVITEGTTPFVSGFTISYERLESYNVEESYTGPTVTMAYQGGVAQGKLVWVATAYDEVSGRERYVGSATASDLIEYNATNYAYFSVNTIPTGYTSIKIYISKGFNEENATLLGFINATGVANKLVFIDQALNASESFPLFIKLVTNDEGGASSIDRANVVLAVASFQERLILGGFTGINKNYANAAARVPHRLAMSKLRQPFNFNEYSVSVNSSYPFVADLADIGRVNHLMNHRRLLAFTDRGTLTVSGRDEGSIALESIVIGSPNKWICDYNVAPVSGGNWVFFSTNQGQRIVKGTFVREFNGYEYKSVTDMSTDLISTSAGIRRLTFSPQDHNILWAAYNDYDSLGISKIPSRHVVGLTMYEGQAQVGYHGHDFGGEIIDVHTTAETQLGGFTYFLIKRTQQDGTIVRFLERLQPLGISEAPSEVVPQLQDLYLDAYVTSFGARYIHPTSIGGLSQATSWEAGETITFTAFDTNFTPTENYMIRFQTGLYTDAVSWDAQVVTTAGDTHTLISTSPVPVEFQGALPTDAVVIKLVSVYQVPDVYLGLGLALKADGVLLSHGGIEGYAELLPTTPSYTIALGGWYDFIVVGIPYVSEVLLNRYLDVQKEDHVDKIKSVISVDVVLKKTKNLRATGASEDTRESITYNEMDEIEGLDEEMAQGRLTGKFNIHAGSDNDRNGQVLFRQYYPDSFSILSASPQVDE